MRAGAWLRLLVQIWWLLVQSCWRRVSPLEFVRLENEETGARLRALLHLDPPAGHGV